MPDALTLSFACSTGILAVIDPEAPAGRSIPVTTPALRGLWHARATLHDGHAALEAWHATWAPGDKQGLALEGVVRSTTGYTALFDVHSSFVALRGSADKCLAIVEEAASGACRLGGIVDGVLIKTGNAVEVHIKKRAGVAVYIAIPANKELHDTV